MESFGFFFTLQSSSQIHTMHPQFQTDPLPKKDMEAHAAGMLYVFVLHTCPITVQNSREIVEHFAEHRPRIIVCTMHELHAILSQIPVRKFSLFADHDGSIDKRVGYNREGYIDGGWQFGMNIIPAPIERRVRFTWNGRTIQAQTNLTEGSAAQNEKRRK